VKAGNLDRDSGPVMRMQTLMISQWRIVAQLLLREVIQLSIHYVSSDNGCSDFARSPKRVISKVTTSRSKSSILRNEPRY